MSELADIPAVILSGGLGTRLRSAVSDRPKVLAEVAGRPFLAWQLDWLIIAGLRRAILCTGYLGEMIRETFGDCYEALELSYSHETTPLGTGGALRAALPLINSPRALVLNGDSLSRANLGPLAIAHAQSGAAITLLLTWTDDASRYGRVTCDEAGRVRQFSEKGQSGPGWINAGVYLIEHSVRHSIPQAGTVSLEREVFPPLLADGRLHGHRDRAAFLDIGTPESLSQAADFCLR